MKIIKKFKEGIHRRIRKIHQKKLKEKMKQNSELDVVLHEYLQKTGSTGCDTSDYYCLYQYIREKKPIEVLELGTGASTVVIAHALFENHKEGGLQGRVTSLEDIPKYYEMAKSLFPEKYNVYADLVHSESIVDFHEMFRGVRYKNVPERQYDFVFIDGPNYTLSDGEITFDLDFIHIVKKSDKPVTAFIDKRFTTCYVLEQVFGEEHFSFDYLNGLGKVSSVTKKDIRSVTPWMRKRFNKYPWVDLLRLLKNIVLNKFTS